MPVKATKQSELSKKPNKYESEDDSDASDNSNNSEIIPNIQKKRKTKPKAKPVRRTNGKKSISFKQGIYKILQNLTQEKDYRISKKAIQIFDDMAIDQVGTFTKECSELLQFNGKSTLAVKDVDTAIKLMTKGGFLQNAILQYKDQALACYDEATKNMEED